MYTYKEIRRVHLELSSRCNARCPQCPRNFYGFPFNDGYIERDLSLVEITTIFKPEFIQQLDEVTINGNYGDIVMNLEAVPIIEYFRQHNRDMLITISTNASARRPEFWRKLAGLECQIWFCIDGLEDTHHLYRQDTSYQRVIRNAQHFIQAGGHAQWKMIQFDHNRHQIEQARIRSQELGFAEFQLVEQGRNRGPVYDRKGNLVHVMGDYKPVSFQKHLTDRKTTTVLLEDIIENRPIKQINCKVQGLKSVYVSSTGHVYPCCFLGFSPETYGHGNYHEAANQQVAKLIRNNNALELGLEQAISWFDYVSRSWDRLSFSTGQLVICQDVCGI